MLLFKSLKEKLNDTEVSKQKEISFLRVELDKKINDVILYTFLNNNTLDSS